MSMEEEAEEESGLGRSAAPKDFHFYHMDLYDSEDRLQLFPGDSSRIRREVTQAEDDRELGDEFVDEHRLGTLGYPSYGMRRRDPGREQRDWGEAAEAEDLVYGGGQGPLDQCQDLREAYRYTHGRASEEYECYVIPEEDRKSVV